MEIRRQVACLSDAKMMHAASIQFPSKRKHNVHKPRRPVRPMIVVWLHRQFSTLSMCVMYSLTYARAKVEFSALFISKEIERIVTAGPAVAVGDWSADTGERFRFFFQI